MGDNNLDTTKGHATEAILFGLVPTGDPRTAAEALAELQQLAETAEYVPAGCIVQQGIKGRGRNPRLSLVDMLLALWRAGTGLEPREIQTPGNTIWRLFIVLGATSIIL